MATAFSDDFNRANENLGVSANWDEQSAGGSPAGRVVNSNTVYLRGGGTYAGSCLVATSAYTFTSQQAAVCTVVTLGSNISGILCRGTTPTGTTISGYGVEISATKIDLVSYDGWNFSYLASAPSRDVIGNWTNTISIGDIIKVEAIGTTIKAYVNGTERISVTDSDNSSGQPGVFVSTSAAGWNYIDDFEGLELTPASGGGSPLALGIDGSWNRNMGHP
jgi:hypothetical protein